MINVSKIAASTSSGMQRQQVNITNGWTVACQHGGQWRECDDFANILQKAA
jgi:hypothetical protein